MFIHLFKMIWNKKRQNALLLAEILLSFLVIFAVCTMLVYYYQNYKKPMGIGYKDVWVVNFINSYNTESADSLAEFYASLLQKVKSFEQVREATYSSDNIPFNQNTTMMAINLNKKNIHGINWYTVGDEYKKVFNLQLVAGRWFESQDKTARNAPVVINAKLQQQLFGNESAVGKILGDYDDKTKMKIIGVVADVKAKGDYSPPLVALYHRQDTATLRYLGKMAILVKPGADAAFEARLYKTIANHLKSASVEIEHLENKRTSINYFNLVPMIVMLIVAGFLIINVALGLFGVLWYNINKRRGEIGLRRAVGATGNSVSGQLVAESLILATLALAVGVFFAVQFPLLSVFDLPAGVYLFAILLAVLFIYLLVFICSLYPGRQAAAVLPATALHED